MAERNIQEEINRLQREAENLRRQEYDRRQRDNRKKEDVRKLREALLLGGLQVPTLQEAPPPVVDASPVRGEFWITSGPGLPVGPAYLYSILERVLKCPVGHDENGHAYIRVPCRSLSDLGGVIGNIVRDEVNKGAYASHPTGSDQQSHMGTEDGEVPTEPQADINPQSRDASQGEGGGE